jgi:hypothetical protein
LPAKQACGWDRVTRTTAALGCCLDRFALAEGTSQKKGNDETIEKKEGVQKFPNTLFIL